MYLNTLVGKSLFMFILKLKPQKLDALLQDFIVVTNYNPLVFFQFCVRFTKLDESAEFK